MKAHNMKWLAMGIVAMSALVVSANEYDNWNKPYTIQALLGGVQYDGLEFATSDGTDTVTVDMSTLPQLGGAWATRPKGEKNLSFGLECSFLLGFKFDDVQTIDGVNNNYVTVSSYLWTFDLAGGAYANLMLGKKLRVYAAAGPLVMLGLYGSEKELPNQVQSAKVTANEFGFGVYARGGLEVQVHQHGYLGAGVRGNYCNIDFTDVGGSSEISGVAAFLTYTAGL